MRGAGISWLLAAPVVLALCAPLSAQQGYATALATESNNQHKLVAHRRNLYVTYSSPVRGIPQVFVDVSSDGRTWRSLGEVSRGAAASTLPTLVIEGTGRVHVAWTQFDVGIGRVYYSRYDGRWSDPTPLSSATSYAGYPSLDIDSRGRLHLVWYGIREATAGQAISHGGIYEIYYLTHDKGWSRPERISEGYPDSINPALAVDRQDRPHAAWFQSDGQAYQVTYASKDGVWSSPVPITAGSHASTKPALAVDGAGRVHLVWERNDAIYYTSGIGGRWDPPVRLSEQGRHPTVGISPRGVFALWQDTNGVIALRAFDGRWQPVRRLEAGDYPNATPWKSSPDPRAFAVWTTRAGINVKSLDVVLGRP